MINLHFIGESEQKKKTLERTHSAKHVRILENGAGDPLLAVLLVV